MIFVLLVTVSLLLLASYLVTKKFGPLAGFSVAGVHLINVLANVKYGGDLTVFRYIYFSLFALLLIISYYKTINRMKI